MEVEVEVGQMRLVEVVLEGGGGRRLVAAAADNSQLAPIKTQKKIDPSWWPARNTSGKSN